MNDTFRLLLTIAIAGCAITLAGSGASWWLDDDRRLRRYIRRALGGAPDAMVVARGRRAGAGFSVAANQAVVMWDGGAKALLYPLAALQGAELAIDDQVVARSFRGEPRRVVEIGEAGARSVTLTLVFNNPRDPRFELDLWLPGDSRRRDDGAPAEAIEDARHWLAQSEALLQPAPAPRARRDAQAAPPEPLVAEPPPWEDDPDDETLSDDDDEPGLFSARPG